MRALFAALLLLAAPAVAQTPAAAPPTPAEHYGALFRAVQLGRVFPDNKTFVDAVPKRPVAAILADYAREQPSDAAALRAFVLANFTVPGVNDVAADPLRAHIRALWPILTRPPLTPAPGGSALALPRPYVVPGGRFREIYYWDSYFTLLGLKADGEDALIEAMLDNFTSLIERYGHIPNGTRSYYLSRSQPPFFALMLDLSANRDPAVAARRLRALRREYAFWMRGAACLGDAGACEHVVRMPDGSLLNRYWDAKATPRDESFAEDSATAAGAADRPRLWRDLRSAAESGWDFSSRWLADGKTLATIHTTDIVPVDLNSLLFAVEARIAARCRAAGDRACAAEFASRAEARKAAMARYLWSAARGWYADFDRATGKPSDRLSAATLYPLFTGVAGPAEASAVAKTVQARLLAPGGLRTTEVATGQQWDRPNGWAPLQWIAIDGLARTGQPALARDIARRWLTTVNAAFAETGKLLEKYDVEERRPGGGGEYPLQDGFGWTNGVASALLDRYPDLAPEKP
ncbi:MAG: trehalase [Proteobacteria bacterium SG_bin6]|nr:MAG: trehalase [Proteobacteria bacterium SG_bin6]